MSPEKEPGQRDDEDSTFRIWIDADGCPRAIKQIAFRASMRLAVPLVLVANRDMYVPRSELIRAVRVSRGFDVADDYIARRVAAQDVVITADVPLAADVVKRGAVAVNPRGEEYTEESIGEQLAMRNLMQELRSTGVVTGGPAQLGSADRHRFAATLDRLLTTRLHRGSSS